jgi:carbon storage regulator
MREESQNTARSKEGSAMLVLSRKLGEKIFINDNICITVVDIDRGKIRLGIEAPRDVPIFRQELIPGHDKAVTPTAVVTAK